MRLSKSRAFLLGIVAAAGMIVLSSCSLDQKEVYGDSQYITCIYDHEDGQLTETIPPGGGKVVVEHDAEVWRVPTSQRFYNIDPDPNVADPGAPQYVTGVEAGYRTVRMPVHAEFYINQARACDFLETHGMRNVQEGVMNNTSIEDKMGFNVRGDAGQPWFVFLNEKFGQALLREGEPLLRQYFWPYYEFNFPTNADQNGVLPCVEGKLDEDTGVCSEYLPASSLARDVIEDQLATAFTSALTEQLGGVPYFCGPGYDPTNPEKCPPLRIIIPRIELEDQTPVADRQAIINLREQAQNNAEEASLTQQSTAAAVAKRTAELEQQKQIEDLNNAAAIQAAQRQGALDQVTQANELAAAEAKAASEAKQRAALCTALGANPSECALLIAASNGQYPQGNNGTNITVTPSGG